MGHILYLNTIVSISIVTLAFISYYFISQSKSISNYFSKRMGEESGQIRLVLFQRLSGFFFFGILPAAIFLFFNNQVLVQYCLRIQFKWSSLQYVAIFGFIAFIVNYYTASAPGNLAMYPQIRAKTWSLSLLLVSGFSWIVYLFAYEFMFRGILLLSCFQELNFIAAIVINVCLYALVHVPKGPKEAIGAIPMGIILCLMTLHFGTIWAAFWIHCCMALSNEWFSLTYHPEMKIRF